MAKMPKIYDASMWVAFYKDEPWVRLDVWMTKNNEISYGTQYILNVTQWVNGEIVRKSEILKHENVYDAIAYSQFVWERLHRKSVD